MATQTDMSGGCGAGLACLQVPKNSNSSIIYISRKSYKNLLINKMNYYVWVMVVSTAICQAIRNLKQYTTSKLKVEA